MNLRTALTALTLCLVLSRCNTAPDSGAGSVTIEGGKPEGTYVDHAFAGTGYRRFEGRTVMIQIGRPLPEERRGEGRTLVYSGAFRIDFPAIRELGLYKSFVLYFDMNGDSLCTPGQDFGFRGATGGMPDPYVYWLESSQVYTMSKETCQQFP